MRHYEEVTVVGGLAVGLGAGVLLFVGLVSVVWPERAERKSSWLPLAALALGLGIAGGLALAAADGPRGLFAVALATVLLTIRAVRALVRLDRRPLNLRI